MKYKVFFINKAFKEVIHANFLLNILEKKKDEFFKRQYDFFMTDHNFLEIKDKCLKYFSNRDDIIYCENEIILTNRITNDTATLSCEENEVVVNTASLDNPLVTFLYASFRPVLIIEKAKVDEISTLNI